jgi:hypothetical protein
MSDTTVDPSGTVVDPSGTVVDPSGTVVDPSGTVVDLSGTVVDLSGTILDASGNPISITEPIPAPPLPTITLSEILSTREVLIQRETSDKAKLDAIATIPIDELRAKLIAWATADFPNNYPVYSLIISPPAVCSDGVVRELADYIVFCSGKTLTEHIAPVQAMLPDITVAFLYSPPMISVVVLKA